MCTSQEQIVLGPTTWRQAPISGSSRVIFGHGVLLLSLGLSVCLLVEVLQVLQRLHEFVRLQIVVGGGLDGRGGGHRQEQC